MSFPYHLIRHPYSSFCHDFVLVGHSIIPMVLVGL